MSEPTDHPRLREWAAYGLSKATAALFTYLPWGISRGLAECLAEAWREVQEKSRKRALQNVQGAFPNLSRAQQQRIVKGAYRSVFRGAVDALQFRRRVQSGAWKALLDVEGMELLDGCDDDRGLIFASGHFGCWELIGLALGPMGFPLTTVMRPPRNPLLARHLRELREVGGQQVVGKRGALRHLLSVLRDGGNVGFLIDRDARGDGMFVDFLGNPASTHTSIARLSIRTRAPIAFIYAHEKPGEKRFSIRISDIVHPRPQADENDEVFRILQRLTKDLEQIIRQHPDRWMWTQNRWKTYPGKLSGNEKPKPGILRRTRNPGADARLRQGPEAAAEERTGTLKQ